MGVPKPDSILVPALQSGSVPWVFDGTSHRSMAVVRQNLPAVDAEDNEGWEIQKFERQELNRMLWSDGVFDGDCWGDGVNRTSFRCTVALGILTVNPGRAIVGNKRVDLGLTASQDQPFTTAFVNPPALSEKLIYLDIFERSEVGPLYFPPAGLSANRLVYADFTSYNLVTSTIKETTVLSGGALPAAAVGHRFFLIGRINSAGATVGINPVLAALTIVKHSQTKKFTYVVKRGGDIGWDCTHTNFESAVATSLASANRIAGAREFMLLVDNNLSFSTTAALTIPDRLSIEGDTPQTEIIVSSAGPITLGSLTSFKSLTLSGGGFASTLLVIPNGDSSAIFRDINLSPASASATCLSITGQHVIAKNFGFYVGIAFNITGSFNEIVDSFIGINCLSAVATPGGPPGVMSAFIKDTLVRGSLSMNGGNWQNCLFESGGTVANAALVQSYFTDCRFQNILSIAVASTLSTFIGCQFHANIDVSSTFIFMDCVFGDAVGGGLVLNSGAGGTIDSCIVNGGISTIGTIGSLIILNSRTTGVGGSFNCSVSNLRIDGFYTTSFFTLGAAGSFRINNLYVEFGNFTCTPTSGGINTFLYNVSIQSGSFVMTLSGGGSIDIIADQLIIRSGSFTCSATGASHIFNMDLRSIVAFTAFTVSVPALDISGSNIIIDGVSTAGTMTLTLGYGVFATPIVRIKNIDVDTSIVWSLSGRLSQFFIENITLSRNTTATIFYDDGAIIMISDWKQISTSAGLLTITPGSSAVAAQLWLDNCRWIHTGGLGNAVIIVNASAGGFNHQLRFNNCDVHRPNGVAGTALITLATTLGVQSITFTYCQFLHLAGVGTGAINSAIAFNARYCSVQNATFSTGAGAVNGSNPGPGINNANNTNAII